MNSAIAMGLVSIAFALMLGAQTGGFPEVAQRLPVLLIWIVVAMAALMIVEETLKRRATRRRAAAGTSIEDDEPPPPPINWLVLCTFSAAIVAYVALIPVVGYVITTPVFITGALLASRTVSPSKAVLVGVGATVFVWVVFVWALSLPVPILPFLK
ncbi:MAG: tripartite tricarboxylate transporter TctB family protein [Rubrivivax sp.]|nr:tripartite tricarboxylate transporter TctB family protein [Rubrivivax sp.]